MIPNLKMYALTGLIVMLVTTIVISRLELHTTEKDFAEYKENINAQLSKAILDKAKIETEQQEKHDREIADYAADRDRLRRIIDGLRKPKEKPKDLPRNSSVSLAGSCTGGVPRSPENTNGSINTITIEARTGSFTYENAMMDTLQCSRLIEFVKP